MRPLNYLIKLTLLVWLSLFSVFFFFPNPVDAQVSLSKFSSNNGTDWVEVINLSAETVNLAGDNYSVKDNTASGNPRSLSCLLPGGSRYSVEWGDSLNNAGDKILLLKGEEVVDCVTYGDGNDSLCSGRDSVDLAFLTAGEYGLKSGSAWIKTNDSAQAGVAACVALSPSASPSPTPTPSSAPTPTSASAAKAVCEIKPRDENGETFDDGDRVSIYIDGNYIHHFAPETLEFCDGCFCFRENQEEVPCGFGSHEIRLEKNGYGTWTETRTFNPGNSVVIDPNLAKTPVTASSPTPSKTPTPKLTSTPSPKTTPTPGGSVTPVPTGEVLGESSVNTYLLDTALRPSPAATPSSQGEDKTLPFVFLASSLVFLFTGGLWLWKKQFEWR